MKRIPFVILLVILFAFALPVFGQTPTFKTTVQWMHNTAEYETGSITPDGFFNAMEIPLTNTCQNFVIIQSQDSTGLQGGHKIVSTTRLNLQSVDPTNIYAKQVTGKPWSYLWIGTTDDTSTIQSTTSVDGNNRPTAKTSGVDFRFDDPDYASRFTKALKHAVLLCGGKPSVF